MAKKKKEEQEVQSVEVVTEQTTQEVAPTTVSIVNRSDRRSKHPLPPAKLQDIAKSLQVRDPNSIGNFGCELATVMNANADEMAKNTRSSSVGEIGKLVADLTLELNGFDLESIAGKEKSWWDSFKDTCRPIPIIGGLIKKGEVHQVNNETIINNVNGIAEKVQATRLIAERDNNTLSVTFDNNLNYIDQIDALLDAGEMKLQEVEDEIRKLKESGNYEAYEMNQLTQFYNRLDKKLDDLSRVQYALKENLLQIQAVQETNNAVMDNANNIVTLTIPLWKAQINLAIALQDTETSVEAQKKIRECTNALFVAMAAKLHKNAVEVAKENQNPVIDTETLRITQQEMIATFNEMREAAEKGKAERERAKDELNKLSQDLVAAQRAAIDAATSAPPKRLKELAGIDTADDVDFEDVPKAV